MGLVGFPVIEKRLRVTPGAMRPQAIEELFEVE